MSFSFARDLDRFSRGTPHAELAALRRAAPVAWHPLANARSERDGFWLVTSYREVVEASKRSDVFLSNHGTLLVDHPPATAPAPWTMIKSELCSLDGDVHTRYRQLAAPSFLPRIVEGLSSAIRELAVGLIDRAVARGTFDFAQELAFSLPVQVVLGLLLGIPEEDRARAAHWSDVLSAPEDPVFSDGPNAALRAVHEMYAYAKSLARARRESPRTDLASALVLSRLPDGSSMSDEMFTHYFWSMILGAFDTTASTLAGGMLALIDHPEAMDRLQRDPALLPSAIEEMLRWVSPVIYFRRTAACDTTLGGVAIREGERVALCYPAANRDETVFPEPDVFDIGRTPNEHVSFGFGRHFCLGARLARIEMRVFFEELLRRDLRLERVGEVVHARSNFLNRIHTFPVRVARAA